MLLVFFQNTIGVTFHSENLIFQGIRLGKECINIGYRNGKHERIKTEFEIVYESKTCMTMKMTFFTIS